MLVVPRSLEVVGEIGGLAIIEINDPLNRVFFTIRLDQHWKGHEAEPIRFEYQVIHYLPRRVHVF